MSEGPEASWLLYGAYGYSGRLIARQAVEEGLRPVLAGRDAGRTDGLARELGLEHRCFPLDDADALRDGLRGVSLVLHAAGPFSRTADAMVRACLERGRHYLDITGEIRVFEAILGRDAEARIRGVLLLPGVGFDVVPTDCAAVRAASRLDRPVALDLAFRSGHGPSRGSARTMLEALNEPAKVRRSGRIVDVRHGSVVRTIPFSDGEREAVAIPWGDVSTAYHSTGVGDVRVFIPLSPGRRRWLRVGAAVLRMPLAGSLARWAVDRFVSGPGEGERREGRATVWCEARDDEGRREVVELETPQGYVFTARSAVAAVREVLLAGPEAPVGALTPSRALGPGFVDRVPGVRWIRP